MSRIPKLEKKKAGLFAQLAAWMSKRKMRAALGKAIAPGPIGVYAHHSGVLSAVGAFEMLAERWNRVEPRLKTLASLRAATLVGCPF
jgi:hypothetical protein